MVKLHVDEAILFQDGASIDPRKFASLSRLGGEWYMETRPDALFELPRPPSGEAIGVAGVLDVAPLASQLSASERAVLGTVSAVPDDASVQEFYDRWRAADESAQAGSTQSALLDFARTALSRHNTADGWFAVLAAQRFGG